MTILAEMSPGTKFPQMRRPLIAILRGITADETPQIISVLCDAGFEAIEIPLNSPDPFRSISLAAETAPKGVLIGAGTVLEVPQVRELAACGGRLMVSPNVDVEVIAAAAGLGMVAMPGVFTATEALLAISAGASALKFFPASVLGPAGVNAIRAVLPPQTVVGAVGGVSESDFPAWASAGINCFGLGSSLYRPGATAQEVAAKAKAVIAAFDATFGVPA